MIWKTELHPIKHGIIKHHLLFQLHVLKITMPAELTLPNFSGNIFDWQSFQDSFKSSEHMNPSLPWLNSHNPYSKYVHMYVWKERGHLLFYFFHLTYKPSSVSGSTRELIPTSTVPIIRFTCQLGEWKSQKEFWKIPLEKNKEGASGSGTVRGDWTFMGTSGSGVFKLGISWLTLSGCGNSFSNFGKSGFKFIKIFWPQDFVFLSQGFHDQDPLYCCWWWYYNSSNCVCKSQKDKTDTQMHS